MTIDRSTMLLLRTFVDIRSNGCLGYTCFEKARCVAKRCLTYLAVKLGNVGKSRYMLRCPDALSSQSLDVQAAG